MKARPSFEQILEALRTAFPHGHADFIPLCISEMELHSLKNHDYAAGGHPLGNFHRRASIYKLYPGLDLSDPAVVAVVDLMKQLDAYFWFKSNKHASRVEGKQARLGDVSVYAKLAKIMEAESEAQHDPTGLGSGRVPPRGARGVRAEAAPGRTSRPRRHRAGTRRRKAATGSPRLRDEPASTQAGAADGAGGAGGSQISDE